MWKMWIFVLSQVRSSSKLIEEVSDFSFLTFVTSDGDISRSCESTWHAGLTCGEYKARTTQEAQQLMNESTDMCRCPSCNHLIQRNGGCLHMTCRCGTDFCATCTFFPFLLLFFLAEKFRSGFYTNTGKLCRWPGEVHLPNKDMWFCSARGTSRRRPDPEQTLR